MTARDEAMEYAAAADRMAEERDKLWDVAEGLAKALEGQSRTIHGRDHNMDAFETCTTARYESARAALAAWEQVK